MTYRDWLSSNDPIAKALDTGDQNQVNYGDALDQEVWIPNYTSSNVDAIAYVRTGQVLYVAFKRKYDRPESSQRIYKYPGVPFELYDDLFSAGSPGGTVWDRLRRAGADFVRIG